MRFALVLTLFLLCLTAFALTGRHHAAQRAWMQRQAAAQRKQAPRPTVKRETPQQRQVAEAPVPGPVENQPADDGNPAPLWTGTGKGLDKFTYADAEKEALIKLQGAFKVYLGDHNPPVEWTPDLDYINKHLVTKREKARIKIGDPVGVMKEVTLQAELTPQTWVDVQQRDEQYRQDQAVVAHRAMIEGRLWLALKVLGGILALCLAVAGYIRLDEWTKGYSNALLRVAATGLVVVVVIVLILIR
jgi:hypothetical protein